MKKVFSWNGIASSHRLMILIIIILGLFNFFFGERVPAGGGLGWDGVNYANIVVHLDSMITQGQLSSYYAQRILPSVIVRSMLLISGVGMSNINIIRYFELYNLLLIVLTCCAWKRVADNFSLSLASRWLGFSGVFINFQCSKQAFYYPVLTDVTALFVAMLMLVFYVEKKPSHLLLVTIVGAFCWPVVSVCGALLLFFLNAKLPSDVIAPPAFIIKSTKTSYLVKYSVFVVLSLSIIGYMFLTQLEQVNTHACNLFDNELRSLAKFLPSRGTSSIERLLNNNSCVLEKFINRIEQLLTALPLLFCALLALKMLIGSWPFFQATVASIRSTRLSLMIMATAAVVIPFLIVKMISNPDVTNPSSLIGLIEIAFLPQEGKFLLPIVSLAVFWGPMVLLLLLNWNKFCIEVRRLGPAVVAVIGIHFLLGLVGEPRFLTIGWPFIVLAIILSFERTILTQSYNYIFVILTIFWAQFWMRINFSPWLGEDTQALQEFPKQLYFMHYGLWMSWWSYCIQFVALVISAFLLHKTLLKVGCVEREA